MSPGMDRAGAGHAGDSRRRRLHTAVAGAHVHGEDDAAAGSRHR
ncbi:MAG TPA: hypothetical protein VGC11_10935 [Acidimicrobiia bacterium]